MKEFDAVVVGSGPNGLAAAIRLVEAGFSTCLFEAKPWVGGGLHSLELGEAGFVHDECSAIHPMGILSPYLKTLQLEEHGLTWKRGDSSVAHPLDGRPAAILYRDFERTGERLGEADAQAWKSLYAPFVEAGDELLSDLMGPLSLPRKLWPALRFAWMAHRPALSLGRSKFRDEAARALFAGLAGHSIMPLDQRLTAAFGLIFGLTGHMTEWPCAGGGSRSIAQALASKFKQLGGELRTQQAIEHLGQLPKAQVILLDLAPRSVVRVAAEHLPASYRRRLERYVYGPGTYKLDLTLDGPIPWSDPEVQFASTVHVGGSDLEIADSEKRAWCGQAPTAPYLIVCQQSQLDDSRAPAGKHTGYAYCHVPAGYPHDVSDLIESQIERFAPGFRDLIRTRYRTSPQDFERLNPNFVGGAVTGGAATLSQLFTRPVFRLNPYSTPNPKLFMCSASTPPGGGVHGMCGYYAAQSAISYLHRGRRSSFLHSL